MDLTIYRVHEDEEVAEPGLCFVSPNSVKELDSLADMIRRQFLSIVFFSVSSPAVDSKRTCNRDRHISKHPKAE